jgi:hypothetical protein
VNGARRAIAALAAATIVTAYAWWVVGLAPFSAGATVAVVVAGAVAMLAGTRARRPGRPTATARRVLPWLVLAGLLVAVQVIAWAQQPRDEHPTLSSLTDAALDSHAARAAAFLAWLAAAVDLARR